MRITTEPWQTHSDSVVFQLWSRKLDPEVRTNQSAHSHTHSHQKLLQFSFPLFQESPWPTEFLLEFPGSWSDFPSAMGWDLTESWLSPGAYWVQMKLPGKLVYFSLESSRGNFRMKEDPEYHQMVQSLIQSWVPPYSSAVQRLKGPEWFLSHWGLQKRCGNIVRQETKWHSEK
jgi:hypothetical protein